MTSLELRPSTNIRALVETLPVAREVLEGFGLHCAGCGVNKYETLEQGAAAHGLRVDAIIGALERARKTGRAPEIAEKDRTPARKAPGAFSGGGRFGAIVPVMSGKGGVGKSLTTALLAVGLRRAGKRVAILDADITGPSIPRLFGLRGPMRVEADPATPPGQQPRPQFTPLVSRSAIEIISSNFLNEDEDTAMVWRGPILSGVIRQFFEQGLWSDADVLLIDLPPGTSDAPLTVLQSLDVDGVVLVTMPQALATMIVRKAAGLVAQLKKPVLGVVENMSYFVAPDTGKRYDIFGPSHADKVAELAHAPVLARIPLVPRMMELADAGRVDEIDDPVSDELAAALSAALAAHPRETPTISLL